MNNSLGECSLKPPLQKPSIQVFRQDHSSRNIPRVWIKRSTIERSRLKRCHCITSVSIWRFLLEYSSQYVGFRWNEGRWKIGILPLGTLIPRKPDSTGTWSQPSRLVPEIYSLAAGRVKEILVPRWTQSLYPRPPPVDCWLLLTVTRNCLIEKSDWLWFVIWLHKNDVHTTHSGGNNKMKANVPNHGRSSTTETKCWTHGSMIHGWSKEDGFTNIRYYLSCCCK